MIRKKMMNFYFIKYNIFHKIKIHHLLSRRFVDFKRTFQLKILSLGPRYNKDELRYSYKSFAVDSLAAGSSKTQTLKCALMLCKNNECDSKMKNSAASCPNLQGFSYSIA